MLLYKAFKVAKLSYLEFFFLQSNIVCGVIFCSGTEAENLTLDYCTRINDGLLGFLIILFSVFSFLTHAQGKHWFSILLGKNHGKAVLVALNSFIF